MKSFRINNKRIWLAAALQIAIILLSVFLYADMRFCAVLSIWMYMLVYLSTDIYSNIEIIGFLLCFFVFIIGGQVALYFLGYDQYDVVFSNQIENHTNFVILLSLVFVFFGYVIGRQNKVRIKKRNSSKHSLLTTADERSIIYTRKVSKWFFYFASVCWFIVLLEKISYYRTYGYYSLFADYSSHLPYFVLTVDNFATIPFYVFCATKPSKKEARIPIIIYAIYMIMSLMTGRRIFVAVGFMILCAIFIINNHDTEETWINKRFLIIVLIALPFALSLLQIYGVSRFGTAYTKKNILQIIRDFIGGQGFTVNVIKYEQLFYDKLGHHKYYSFYNTIRFLRTSPLTRWFMPEYHFEYGTYTAKNAINGNSFANSVTYLGSPKTFLRGGGYGSCYVAELFHDFGYAGVIIGNTVLGLFLSYISKFKNRGIFFAAFSLLMLECLYKTPRYNFDYVMSEITILTNWIYAGFMVLVISILYRRGKHRVENRGS